MPAWKVLFVAVFGLVCFGLFLGTILSPLIFTGEERWYYFGGFLAGTLLMGTLYVLFLRREDRKFR
jgi:hypothetical protein